MDETQQDLGNVLQWAKDNNDVVILEQSGKPEGVLMAYDEYTELTRIRRQAAKQKALAVIDAISREASARNQDISMEEAYRLAGFSEEVIQETLENDRKLAQ
jgi:hypothetical protein